MGLKDAGFQVLAAMPPARAENSATQQDSATSSSIPIALDDVDFAVPTALVFGNERHGVSAAMVAACDGAFTVPLPGLSESLNVSVAVAVCCHFARHRRSKVLGLAVGQGDLSPDEAEALAM